MEEIKKDLASILNQHVHSSDRVVKIMVDEIIERLLETKSRKSDFERLIFSKIVIKQLQKKVDSFIEERSTMKNDNIRMKKQLQEFESIMKDSDLNIKQLKSKTKLTKENEHLKKQRDIWMSKYHQLAKEMNVEV